MSSSPIAKHTLTLGTQTVEYTVKVSTRARRLRIRVGPDGIQVTLPRRVPQREAAAFLQANAAWVLLQLERQKKADEKQRLPEGKILLHGVLTSLEVVPTSAHQAACRVEWGSGKLKLHLPPAVRAHPMDVLQPWLREQARRELEACVKTQAARMGAHPARIFIRDQRTRWGACSTLGNLSFNWRLVMAPPEVMEYVVIHELAHLTEMNHSPYFWEVVRKYCPEYRQRQAWLKENRGMLYPGSP